MCLENTLHKITIKFVVFDVKYSTIQIAVHWQWTKIDCPLPSSYWILTYLGTFTHSFQGSNVIGSREYAERKTVSQLYLILEIGVLQSLSRKLPIHPILYILYIPSIFLFIYIYYSHTLIYRHFIHMYIITTLLKASFVDD